MQKELQIIYQAIDRGVQKGVFNAKEAYDVLTAFNVVANSFIVPAPQPETKPEDTSK